MYQILKRSEVPPLRVRLTHGMPGDRDQGFDKLGEDRDLLVTRLKSWLARGWRRVPDGLELEAGARHHVDPVVLSAELVSGCSNGDENAALAELRFCVLDGHGLPVTMALSCALRAVADTSKQSANPQTGGVTRKCRGACRPCRPA